MLQRIRAARQSEDGFTLIELLIVIVILGVLAGIVVFGVAQFQQDSERAACRADLKTVQVAADAYNAQVGSYPSSIDLLVQRDYLTEEPPNKNAYVFDVAAKRVTRNPAC